MENNQQTPIKTTTKRKKVIFGSLIILAVLGIGAYVFWQYQQKNIIAPTGQQTTYAKPAAGASAGSVQEARQEVEQAVQEKLDAQQKAEEEAAAQAAKEAEEAAKAGKGKKVAIDPGHQGWNVDMSAKEPNAPGSSEMKAKSTSGASGNYSGLAEFQLNLDVSLQLRTELEKRGYEVLLTREDNNTAISNAERAVLSNEWGADIYVRIHANSSESASAQGALTLIPSSGNPYAGSQYSASRALAESILASYCSATEFANKGIQENDTMTGINWSTRPVVILEMGFMSNQHDDLKMADSAFQIVMVQGIADGIDNYFGN